MLFERDNSGQGEPRQTALRPPHYAPQSVVGFRGVTQTSGFVLNDFSRSKLDWAWTCDASLCLTDLSEGFTAMTGFLPTQFLGSPLEDLGVFDDQDRGAALLAMLSRGEAVSDAAFLVRTQGEAVSVRLSAVPVFTNDNQLLGFEGGMVRAAAAPEEAGEGNDPAAARQLDLAHQVQHELRTPLNAIAGFAQIMREDLKGRADGRYAAYCDDILSASQHLLGLIDDLVGAHAAQPTVLADATVTPFALGTLLQELGRLIEPIATKENRTFHIDTVDADLMCTSDRRRLKQICLNLLENAVKFTPPGKALGLSVTLPHDGALDLTIWDQGPGIKEDDQALIWQRFQKSGASSSDTATSPGMGLGLSVVKSLADSIGAQLLLDSSAGNGSRFTVRLAQVF